MRMTIGNETEEDAALVQFAQDRVGALDQADGPAELCMGVKKFGGGVRREIAQFGQQRRSDSGPVRRRDIHAAGAGETGIRLQGAIRRAVEFGERDAWRTFEIRAPKLRPLSVGVGGCGAALEQGAIDGADHGFDGE